MSGGACGAMHDHSFKLTIMPLKVQACTPVHYDTSSLVLSHLTMRRPPPHAMFDSSPLMTYALASGTSAQRGTSTHTHTRMLVCGGRARRMGSVHLNTIPYHWIHLAFVL